MRRRQLSFSYDPSQPDVSPEGNSPAVYAAWLKSKRLFEENAAHQAARAALAGDSDMCSRSRFNILPGEAINKFNSSGREFAEQEREAARQRDLDRASEQQRLAALEEERSADLQRRAQDMPAAFAAYHAVNSRPHTNHERMEALTRYGFARGLTRDNSSYGWSGTPASCDQALTELESIPWIVRYAPAESERRLNEAMDKAEADTEQQ